MHFIKHVKNELLSIIKEMALSPEKFVKNSNVDFVRHRKLDFETTLQFLLSAEGNCLKKELLEYFNFNDYTPTTSAFCQQRNKLALETFIYLFNEFNSRFIYKNNYKGYQVLACDGSDLNIFVNGKDKDTFFPTKPGQMGFNQLHLNALYDVCNKRFVDLIVQPARKESEPAAMVEMINKFQGDKKTIFMADRGYEGYNILYHVLNREMFYLLRAKDGTAGGIVQSLPRPETDEYDIAIDYNIINRKSAEKDDAQIYHYYKHNKIDCLNSQNHTFPLKLRMIRFKISQNKYEMIITNLPKNKFRMDDIKRLYAMRWGIETSFRELKYALGLTSFYSKKSGLYYARNICSYDYI